MRVLLAFFVFLIMACKPTRQPEVKQTVISSDALIAANQHLLKQEKSLIENYIARKGWEITEKPSGLFYKKYKAGEGKKVLLNQEVTIAYRVELLDGTLCYSSETDGDKTFITGKGLVEKGLDEAILDSRVGDKLYLIIPPHLGYGLAGDMDKIPPRSVLVYDLEILNVKE
jgi:FKBP-type peptidyl-prolyl cis-trans isomerase FkpA